MNPPPSAGWLTRTLEADPRFYAAVLFGSAARDALHADSDVDVAVMYADRSARKSPGGIASGPDLR